MPNRFRSSALLRATAKRIAGAMAFPLLCAAPSCAQEPQRPAGFLEDSVCGVLSEESAVFAGWRDAAAQGGGGAELPGFAYQRIEVRTADRRKLSGLRIFRSGEHERKRALLVLLGNAMLADQLKAPLGFFAEAGYHVFVFDYRGYGKSEGRPLLKPIAADQAHVVAYIKGLGYPKLFLYGMSFGGILAAGPTIPRRHVDATVIDSARAVIQWYAFCPHAYDPQANVPERASNMMVLSGGEDTVVPADVVRPLGELVQQRGGVYRHIPDFAHPMMEDERDNRRRFSLVLEFLSRF